MSVCVCLSLVWIQAWVVFVALRVVCLSSLSLQHACVHECVCVCVFVSGVDTGLSSFCSFMCCLPVIFVTPACMCAWVCVFVSGVNTGLSSFCSFVLLVCHLCHFNMHVCMSVFVCLSLVWIQAWVVFVALRVACLSSLSFQHACVHECVCVCVCVCVDAQQRTFPRNQAIALNYLQGCVCACVCVYVWCVYTLVLYAMCILLCNSMQKSKGPL